MVDSEGFYVHSCRFYRGTPNELREVGREFIHAYDHSRIVAFGRNEGDDRSGVSTYSIITRCRIDGLRNLFMKNLDDFGAFSVKYPGIFLTDESDGFSVDSDSLHVRVISTRGLPPDAELDRISVHIQDIRQYMGPDALLHFDITDAHPEQAYMICKLSAIYPICSFVRDGSGAVSTVLAPFPPYRSMSQPTIDALEIMASELKRSKDTSRHRSHEGFVTGEELGERLGHPIDNPSDFFRNLVSDGLVMASPEKVRSPTTNRLVSQYRITEEGLFMLHYVINSKGLKGREGRFRF